MASSDSAADECETVANGVDDGGAGAAAAASADGDVDTDADD